MIAGIYRVSGNSLHPRFQHGDFVLVSRFPHNVSQFKLGDAIVFRHASYGTMIKLVSKIDYEADEIEVIGTHNGSVDSRSFGPISNINVLGKVVFHLGCSRPNSILQKERASYLC